jgi:hypothetical protein
MRVQIVNLNHRTGLEFVLFAIRKDLKQYSAPYVFRTSDLFQDFFQHITKYTLSDLALKLESFFLGGVDGEYIDTYLYFLCFKIRRPGSKLCRETCPTQVFDSLPHQGEAQYVYSFICHHQNLIIVLVNAAGHSISRMVYTNFDEAITLKHAVILKGWPLPKFCCPSHITGCSDLEILYNAWKSGAAHFVKLNDKEYEEWRSRYLQQRAGADPISSISNEESTINVPTPNIPSEEPSTHVTDSPVNEVQPMVATPIAATNASSTLATATSSFVNFGADGSLIPRKARKPRKDKGVPRGSRKGKGKENKA